MLFMEKKRLFVRRVYAAFFPLFRKQMYYTF